MDRVTTPEGLELEVLVLGGDDGFPLVFHSGTPSAAVPFPQLERALAPADLRMITYSRPGYGTSTTRSDPDRAWSVADDVADTVAILEALGIGDFLTLGWSGGGPRALGCAALLPDRCRAALTLGGVAPYDAVGLDFVGGMGPENVRDFEAAAAGRDTLQPLIEAEVAEFSGVTADGITAAFGELIDEVDAAALTGEFAEYVAESFRRASLQGSTGFLEDSLVMVRPWGFDVAEVTVPVSIWQGAHDLMVPFSHGQWLAAHVAGARAHLFDDEGHLTLLDRMDEVLAELRELAGLPAVG
jgi:pimeloyl-ACP methyl ester carboxylesterase